MHHALLLFDIIILCDSFSAPVHGGWGEWRSTDCTKTCGGGVRHYYRDCDDPAPAHGGKYCSGRGYKYYNCNTQCCPGVMRFILALKIKLPLPCNYTFQFIVFNHTISGFEVLMLGMRSIYLSRIVPSKCQ